MPDFARYKKSNIKLGTNVSSKHRSNNFPLVLTPGRFVARHDTLLEHDWPPLSGQTWVLQDNLAEFVGIKNIKRRYPELTRRNIESDEREFLRAKGYVTDMQCDLGLVALRLV